jgi:hypothetical protein
VAKKGLRLEFKGEARDYGTPDGRRSQISQRATTPSPTFAIIAAGVLTAATGSPWLDLVRDVRQGVLILYDLAYEFRLSAALRQGFDAGSGQAEGRRAAGTKVVIGATRSVRFTIGNCERVFWFTT